MIVVTDAAFERLSQIFKTPNDMLRISVDGGGCSGFMYKYEIVTAVTDDDHVIANADGKKVVIDSVSMGFLDNSHVDYVTELGASYFAIKNPNAKAKCGCGNSFNV